MLFIDEAYSLVENYEGEFGDEAINTIVQEMENNREDTVVIFAICKMDRRTASSEGAFFVQKITGKGSKYCSLILKY